MFKTTNFLIWIDLEMTGLNVNKDKIIEIATLVTNKDLDIISEDLSIVVKQEKNLMDNMDVWNTNQHKKSGLYQKVLKSQISCSNAENMVLNFLKNYTKEKISPMCGNTIYQDRIFLKKYMPKLENFFHYRNIDVSTIKQLMKYWKYDSYKKLKKSNNHTALIDIKESIKELSFYKEVLFKV